MNGYVYILGNPAFQGILKIGRTTKDPQLRANELHTTGVPQPYTVLYYKYVEDHEMVESYLHEKFAAFRENTNREFFRLSLKVVVDELLQFPEIHFTKDSFSNEKFNNVNDFFHLYLAVSDQGKKVQTWNF